LLIELLVLTLQVAGPPPIGVAAGGAGEVCLAIGAPTLQRGAVVTLVEPEPPQSARRATVAERVTACDAFSKSDMAGPFYRLDVPGGASAFHLAVAFVGAVSRTPVGVDAIVVHLSAAYPRVRVRSCTSSEGVHLTAWAGVPLESRRLWHTYFYLGYDVEPSCKDADVREP
jgi:hypothetical protein